MCWESVNQGHEAKTLTNRSQIIYLCPFWPKEQSEINPRALKVRGEDTKQRARTSHRGTSRKVYTGHQLEHTALRRIHRDCKQPCVITIWRLKIGAGALKPKSLPKTTKDAAGPFWHASSHCFPLTCIFMSLFCILRPNTLLQMVTVLVSSWWKVRCLPEPNEGAEELTRAVR